MLCEICPSTYIMQVITGLPYLIEDIVVVENNFDTIEILILTKPNDEGLRTMKIIEYPSKSKIS